MAVTLPTGPVLGRAQSPSLSAPRLQGSVEIHPATSSSTGTPLKMAPRVRRPSRDWPSTFRCRRALRGRRLSGSRTGRAISSPNVGAGKNPDDRRSYCRRLVGATAGMEDNAGYGCDSPLDRGRRRSSHLPEAKARRLFACESWTAVAQAIHGRSLHRSSTRTSRAASARCLGSRAIRAGFRPLR